MILKDKFKNRDSKVFYIHLIVFLFLVFWIASFSIPIFSNKRVDDFYFILKIFYSPVCHQNAERCFSFNNIHFLVCSRCTGIYIGLLLSSIILFFRPYIKIRVKLLIFSFLPMLIDVVMYTLKIYPYNKIIALFSGIIFGSILFFFIFEIITESVLKANK